MARLVWAVFCQQALVDKFSNTLSIINVLEELHVSRPPEPASRNARPAAQMQCAVVSLWERTNPTEPESGKVRLRLVGPDGKKQLEALQLIDLTAYRRTRLIVELPFIPVVGEGIYRIDVYAGSGDVLRKAGSISYELHVRDSVPPVIASTDKH